MLVLVQEIANLIHGFAYYLAIPTMYMLLMIYSICNLHVVSWGTREVKQTPTEKQEEEARLEQKRLEEEAKKPKSGLLESFRGGKKQQDEGWTLRCGDCFSYVCCPRHRSEDEKVVELKLVLAEIEKLEMSIEKNVDEKLAALKTSIDELRPPPGPAADTSGYLNDDVVAEAVAASQPPPDRGRLLYSMILFQIVVFYSMLINSVAVFSN